VSSVIYADYYGRIHLVSYAQSATLCRMCPAETPPGAMRMHILTRLWLQSPTGQNSGYRCDDGTSWDSGWAPDHHIQSRAAWELSSDLLPTLCAALWDGNCCPPVSVQTITTGVGKIGVRQAVRTVHTICRSSRISLLSHSQSRRYQNVWMQRVVNACQIEHVVVHSILLCLLPCPRSRLENHTLAAKGPADFHIARG